MSNVISALILAVSIILGAMAHARVTHYFSPFETCTRTLSQGLRMELEGSLTMGVSPPSLARINSLPEEERELGIKALTIERCALKLIK